jgi:hypothetical protein
LGLTCQSHFLYLNLQIGPQAFKHTHCILGKNVFLR